MSVYACSDLHGCWEQWNKIRQLLKEDDILFVLGDCIDRGDSGIAILNEALEDKRIILLCGNHEDMMIQAIDDMQDGSDYWPWIWFNNGGHVTYNDWTMNSCDMELIKKLERLPLFAEYQNCTDARILLNHSGIVPKTGYGPNTCGRKALLWDRKHIDEIKWHSRDYDIVIHGHTPVPYMPKYEYMDEADVPAEPYWYCDGHKCNIDLGGVFTGKFCLLDLDTFESRIIE